MNHFDAAIRRTGTFGAIGGALVFGSVAAELVHPVQSADGSSTEPMLHALYLLAWIVGWSLIAFMAIGLRGAISHVGSRSRRLSLGSWLTAGGAAAFVLSGLGLMAGVLTGVNLEAAFVLILLAFPLLVAGYVTLALAMRRGPVPANAWVLLLLGAIGLLVALLAEADPFHDIGLLAGALATSGFGVRLALGRDSLEEPDRLVDSGKRSHVGGERA
jgi:hypothetical protein